MAEPAILIVVPSGIRKRATEGSACKSCSAVFMVTGIVAALDEVEKANNIGVMAPLRNHIGDFLLKIKINKR